MFGQGTYCNIHIGILVYGYTDTTIFRTPTIAVQHLGHTRVQKIYDITPTIKKAVSASRVQVGLPPRRGARFWKPMPNSISAAQPLKKSSILQMMLSSIWPGATMGRFYTMRAYQYLCLRSTPPVKSGADFSARRTFPKTSCEHFLHERHARKRTRLKTPDFS